MEDGQQDASQDERSQGPAWGFLLVPAAIEVVAIVYAVTMFAVGPSIRTLTTGHRADDGEGRRHRPLVGTYFGVKACPDGQEKVRKAAGGLLHEGRVRPTGRGPEGQAGQ